LPRGAAWYSGSFAA